MAQEEAKEFTRYFSKLNNYTMVAHGIGLGSTLGLFDVICNMERPVTCDEIATAGNFKERYVREWLCLMVTGNIIEFNDKDKTYWIPQYRVPFLTKQGKEKNMAIFLSGISIVTSVQNELAECFKKDGPNGIPYSSYPGFHEWRSNRVEAKYQWCIMHDFFSKIPGFLEQLEGGIHVADAGCSAGHQLLQMAQHFPKSTFLGFDIDQSVMDRANRTANDRGLNNISFVIQDACNMPNEWTNRFDCLMVWDVVHDVPYSTKFVSEIERVLKPGGLFFMNDLGAHSELSKNKELDFAPLLFGMSLFHCMSVSLYHEGGEGLGTCWGKEKQVEYLKNAGFVGITELEVCDRVNSYFISYKKEN